MSADRKRVLVADDETDVHDFVQVALEDMGLEFVTATDGEEAVAKAMSELPDLVILDVQMPKKDGFQVFGELRRDAATKSIPVIMLTGVGARTGIAFSADDMGKYLGEKPDAYVEKPVDPTQLQAAVKALLE